MALHASSKVFPEEHRGRVRSLGTRFAGTLGVSISILTGSLGVKMLATAGAFGMVLILSAAVACKEETVTNPTGATTPTPGPSATPIGTPAITGTPFVPTAGPTATPGGPTPPPPSKSTE